MGFSIEFKALGINTTIQMDSKGGDTKNWLIDANKAMFNIAWFLPNNHTTSNTL